MLVIGILVSKIFSIVSLSFHSNLKLILDQLVNQFWKCFSKFPSFFVFLPKLPGKVFKYIFNLENISYLSSQVVSQQISVSNLTCFCEGFHDGLIVCNLKIISNNNFDVSMEITLQYNSTN